jgi:ubiquitin-protein ligase
MELLNTQSLYSLESFELKRIKNRIIKDLSALSNVSSSIMIHIDDNKNLPVITVEDNQYNSYVYSFIIDNSYPFRPPVVMINSIPYINFCRINTVGFCNNLKKVGGIYCFCCNSIIHSVKWSPTVKLSDIIMEIRNFKKMRRDVINKICADVIIRKYLNNDIYLYSWLF